MIFTTIYIYIYRYAWFLEQTASLIRPWEDGHLKMRVHRENILVESMEQLLGVQMEHIHMPLRIEFIGEIAIDAGGLEREWYVLVLCLSLSPLIEHRSLSNKANCRLSL